MSGSKHAATPDIDRSDERPAAEHHQHGMEDEGTSAAHGGHDRHAGHSVAMFRDKFWLIAGADHPGGRC